MDNCEYFLSDSLAAVGQLNVDEFNPNYLAQFPTRDAITQSHIDDVSVDQVTSCDEYRGDISGGQLVPNINNQHEIESDIVRDVEERLDALISENADLPIEPVINMDLSGGAADDFMPDLNYQREMDIEREVQRRLDKLIREIVDKPLLFGGGTDGGSRQLPEVYNYQASGSGVQKPPRCENLHTDEVEKLLKGFKRIGVAENSRRDQHFRQCYRKTSIRFHFKNVESVDDFDEAVEEITQYIRAAFKDADSVGLRFRLTNNVDDDGVYITPRRMDQINGDVIMEQYANVVQSNREFQSYGDVYISVDQIYEPRGGGGRKVNMRLPSDAPEVYKLTKRSITFSLDFMEPGETTCLFISIALAVLEFTDSIKKPTRRTGAKNKALYRNTVRSEARRIAQKAGIVFNDQQSLPSLAEFEKVQTILNRYSPIHDGSKCKNPNWCYKLVIYDRIGELIFAGSPVSDNVEIHNVNLLLDRSHFDLIISCPGAFSYKYFCDHCHKGFDHYAKHKNCTYVCESCFRSPPCSSFIGEPPCEQPCRDCLRVFYNTRCFKNHLEKGQICKKFRICKLCDKSKHENHECGFFMCFQCKALKPFQHTCFVPVYLTPNPKKKLKHIYVFFDFEALIDERSDQSGYDHTINLCVSNTVCDNCLTIQSDEYTCATCGERENIFQFDPHNDNSVIDAFLEYVCGLGLTFKVTVISHNGSRYDNLFLARRIFEKYHYSKPSVVLAGKKLFSLTFGNIRIIDSLNFVQAPLSKIPGMFNLPAGDKKGYFGHGFNTRANQNYIGHMPDRRFYEPESMKTDDLKEFEDWYVANSEKVFDFQKEIVMYCKQDTRLLRKFCLILRAEMFNDSGIEIFRESVTLASYVNKVFRKNFYEQGSIALVPKNGYRLCDPQSTTGIMYLRYMEKTLNSRIQSAFNGYEKVLCHNGKSYKVDGYMERLTRDADGQVTVEKHVFEFHGCYYHHHTCMEARVRTFNPHNSRTAERLMCRDVTARKTAELRALGYKVTEMYECEFRKILQANPELKRLRDDIEMEKLDPRDAFYGGKTEAVVSYRKAEPGEKIVYFDVCSLYPTVNKFDKMVLGRPKIVVGDVECRRIDINSFEGLIKCKVLPPRKLFHPILPVKLNGKLLFTLCYACAKDSNQGDCGHEDDLRAWVGTFVIDELRVGIEVGYRIMHIHEMWEYRVTVGLFSKFVTHYQSEKLYASGLPTGVDDANIDEYIKAYEKREGLKLDKTRFGKNPAKRTFMKFILNSLWGKFGECDHSKTDIVTTPENLFKLVSNDQYTIKGMEPISESVMLVNYSDSGARSLNTTSVVVAAYTTAMARLRLNKLLTRAGTAALYADTDSIIAVQKIDAEPLFEAGIFLGDLTDELECYGRGSYITEFVCLGPKSYAFRVLNPSTGVFSEVTKVKGITLNAKNKAVINFQSMKNQILNTQSTALTVQDTFFVRTRALQIYTTKRKKTFKPVLNKRRRIGEVTIPYGYSV